MLGCILATAVLYIIRFRRTASGYTKTYKIPFLRLAVLGAILGGILGVLLSMYVIPPDWWNNSDFPRNVDLGVLGAILGMIFGGVFSLFYVKTDKD